MSRFQALRASWVSCFGSVDSPTSARKCEVRSSAFSSAGLPTGPGAPNVHPARRHTPPPKFAHAEIWLVSNGMDAPTRSGINVPKWKRYFNHLNREGRLS